MSYFLKKTNNKKGTYLQIYESYYDPERKQGAHRSYKPLGYVHELQEKGIQNPLSFFAKKCKNSTRSQKGKSSLKRHSRYPMSPRNGSLGISR